MAQSAPISTTGVPKVGAVAVSLVQRQLMSDLQLLNRHYYKPFTNRYGRPDYFTWLWTFAPRERVMGKEFYHWESRSKLMDSFASSAAVTAPAAGASVTVTLSADSHITEGAINYSAPRAGENVRLASNDKEAQIISVNRTVANAHTVVLRPLSATVALSSAGSADLVAGEVFKLVGMVDRGEASGSVETITPIHEKITGYISTFHDTYSATDHAEMEEVEYEAPPSEDDLRTSTEGMSAYTLMGMQDWNRKYMNNRAGKLMYGQLITNTGLPTGAVGTQGLIPAIIARGTNTTYTAGSMTIAKIHEIMRINKVNGGPKQVQWLQDIFQNQEFSDGLFAAYGGGAFVYGTNGSTTEEASVAYGFKNLNIDDTLIQTTQYPFNTEEVYGRSPAIDAYRNFGIIIPQGTVYDKGTAKRIPNLSIMYQEPPPINTAAGSVVDGLKVYRHGGASPNPTSGTQDDHVEMVSYMGLRTGALNQFQLVTGS